MNDSPSFGSTEPFMEAAGIEPAACVRTLPASKARYVNGAGVAFFLCGRIGEGPPPPLPYCSGLCVNCPGAGDAWYLFERREGHYFALCDGCFEKTTGVDPARPRGVYFVRGGDMVKIGYSADIRKRITQLATGCPVPLELWRHMHGTQDDERALHERFADERSHGEWFRISDRLRDFIEAA